MKFARIIGILLILLVITSCNYQGTFKTNDEDYDIYYEVDEENNFGVIMLSSFKGHSGDWNSLWSDIDNATKARMDFRGHGRSTGSIDFLSEEDYSKFITDAKMLKARLKQFHNVSSYMIIGSSLGANIAVKMASEDDDVKALVLLSPGEVYKGYDIRTDYPTLKIPILAIASKKDFYSQRTVSKLSFPNLKKLIIEGEEHGTDMLSNRVNTEIIDFVNESIGYSIE